MKFKLSYFLLLFSLLIFNSTALAVDNLPAKAIIEEQLESAKKDSTPDQQQILDLETTLMFLEKIEHQKKKINELNKNIAQAEIEIPKLQLQLKSLQSDTNKQNNQYLAELSAEDLQTRLEQTLHKIQMIQTKLNNINSELVNQQTLPEKTQIVLGQNLTRSQKINQELLNSEISEITANRYQTELAYIELENNYTKSLLKDNNIFTNLYSLQRDEQNYYLQQSQQELKQLQDQINIKHQQQSQQQLEKLEQSQKNAEKTNPIIQEELDLNNNLSRSLLKETENSNILLQESLRIKNVLDNLTQTQRTINEQISALQGTLVLSRIINKQKQNLPAEKTIKGLSKRISDLRVQIFDLTQTRDQLYSPQEYLNKLQLEGKNLTEHEVEQLKDILNKRKNILSEIIKTLNNELNLAITIELNQRQVTLISDNLQKKLQQQSFWVKSNSPIDWEWLKNFPKTALSQLKDIGKQFVFSTKEKNLTIPVTLTTFISILIGLILWKKEKLQAQLTKINREVRIVSSDSQWHTPIALLLTLILTLPNALIFLNITILCGIFFLKNPTELWYWSIEMAAYWWFFAFLIATLKPDGLGYRHFGQSKESNQTFLAVLKKSIWIIIVLVNTSVFGNIENRGAINDVIGQTITISSLLFCLIVISPNFGQAVKKYQTLNNSNQNNGDGTVLKIVLILLILIPISLVLLIALGYYYTALNLINHLILSYLVTVIWFIAKQVLNRALTVSARRLAYKRLQEKKEQLQAKLETPTNTNSDEPIIEVNDETLELSQIKQQITQVADLTMWAVLFSLYYWVWSDLLTVTYYLQGITLWQQHITTESGTAVESVTLFNLFVAILILVVMYALVRNIGGLLEVLIFSRMKLSQGAPYTITTLFTYFIVAIGSIWAFSTLGVAWSNLQWLVSALLVGLGFGLQEIFANFVSGIIILFERPIRIGDTITIGEFSGTVSKIRIRATTLIDYDRKEVIVPNKAFVTERLTNWALSNTITRIVIKVGVAYGSDLELTNKLLLQAANEASGALKDPEPKAYFLSFGASTLDHELRVYVGQISDRLSTMDFINRRIDQLFKQHNIEIAFNQLDVYIKNLATQEEIQLNKPTTNTTQG
ncbi:mechanosensitive channel MscK [Mergibacter septicus]|uniref:Mechanosensitive channel MscK n=1 Tax=Mergibacter septicus TaxID=221402 RepID=A0A8E3S9Q4_9PAST|nr:mechanosensitive channel MscK [Mergibacter septicus]AWX15151.1 mechanosensitive channel MscK [Mergibacter septicus]QDJ14404.1 mechanosensitive channel MscK [Mergibacter septicus]UTU48157.1 mechanosensitive channel MscK [Mergibacter septicus]WMR96225.1 mechanosensitive channel MscK [Mergibacter septicus]